MHHVGVAPWMVHVAVYNVEFDARVLHVVQPSTCERRKNLQAAS